MLLPGKRSQELIMGTSARCLVAALALAGSLSAGAQGMEISILDLQLTTDLSYEIGLSVPTPHRQSDAQTTTSATPISIQLLSPSPRVFANVNADAFSVLTSTSALWDPARNETTASARATAQSVVKFEPMTDGVAPLSFVFDGDGPQSAFSRGFVSLFDITLDKPQFYYSWDRLFDLSKSNIPWTCCYDAVLNLGTQLFSSHKYTLSMSVGTDANTDSQAMSIMMSGVSAVPPVPEPETWAMMLVGLGGVLFASRRRALVPAHL